MLQANSIEMIKKILTSVLLFCINGGLVLAQPDNPPNVLFIAIDDLNDWIGVMEGHPQAKTPHIDALAKSGMLFTNAHCQAPICGPSRASVMSGLYPFTTGNYLQQLDKDIKKSNSVSAASVFMPDYFEQYGYKTMGAGKIYHRGDGAKTFDEYYSHPDPYGPKPVSRLNYDPKWFDKPGGTGTDWGAYPVADSLMPDYHSAQWAADKLSQLHEKPFFMAVGFVRPHVPWYVPDTWFEDFPLDSIQLPSYLAGDMEDIPEQGKRVAAVPMMPDTPWLQQTGQWKKMIQAYLACIRFVDAQVGKVLTALANSHYASNTIVVLWSDHGYHLGEKNRVAKQSLWERSTKTVMIWKEPSAEPGRVSDQPVQLIDMYPTLLELAGLPANNQNEGHSLVPLLQHPDSKWPYLSLTSYGRQNTAVTGKRYKLIRYDDASVEFYDLKNDPNEWHNLASDNSYRQLIEEYMLHIPQKQAPLSPYSRYTINEYFRALD